MRSRMRGAVRDTGRRSVRIAALTGTVIVAIGLLAVPAAADPVVLGTAGAEGAAGGRAPAPATADQPVGRRPADAVPERAGRPAAPKATPRRPAEPRRPGALPPPRRPEPKPQPRDPKRPGVVAKSATVSCGGAISFGEVYRCASIKDADRHVFTFATTAANDQVRTQFGSTGDQPDARIETEDGTYLCSFSSATRCDLREAGTYRVVVFYYFGRGAGSYSFAVDSVLTPSACTALDAAFFSFASPGRSATLEAGSAGDCYEFSLPSGTVLWTNPLSDSALGDVIDSTGAGMCPLSAYAGPCALTGTGPYRVFVYDSYGAATPYRLSTPALTAAAGCAPQRVAAFGDPGDAAKSGSVRYDETDCFSVEFSAGPHFVQLISGNNVAGWQIYDQAGQLVCQPPWSGLSTCEVPADGRYTALVRYWERYIDHVDYQLAAVRLAATDGCAAPTGTAWNTPELTVKPASEAQLSCQPFTAQPGERIVTTATAHRYDKFVRTWITDGTGLPLCAEYSDETGCVLPGSGPYRVLSFLVGWAADDRPGDREFTLAIRRLSNPEGCLEVSPGRFGEPAPAPVANAPCRLLKVPAAGTYTVEAIDGGTSNHPVGSQVYTSDGLKACSTACTFGQPGNYTLIAEGAFTTVFLPRTGTGCVHVADSKLAPVAGKLTGPGQVDCLELPTPAGKTVKLAFAQDITGPTYPDLLIVDADGGYVCTPEPLGSYGTTCELSGTAPFRVHIRTREDYPTGSYRVVPIRTDGLQGCPPIPTGRFGAETGLTVQLTPGRFVACGSIPANAHSTSELVSLTRTAGAGVADVRVFDADGKLTCATTAGAAHFDACALTSKRPYTAIVVGAAQKADYRLTRRDITAAAVGCATSTLSAIGGRPATGAISSAGQVNCHKVRATPGDRLWINTREDKDKHAYVIADAAGAISSCITKISACQATGSTSYQILVWNADRDATRMPYAVDTWRLPKGDATPAECATFKPDGYGWGPVTGTLTARKPADCGSVLARQQALALTVTTPSGAVARPWPYVVTVDGIERCWANGEDAYHCQTWSPGRGETVLVVMSLDGVAAPVPYSYVGACESGLCPGFQFTVTGVQPDTVTAGPGVHLTLRGTSLHPDDEIWLTRDGSDAIVLHGTSVSKDRTTLDVVGGLSDATPGRWNLRANSHSGAWQSVTLEDAVTVNAKS
jgi:hypothetical protein